MLKQIRRKISAMDLMCENINLITRISFVFAYLRHRVLQRFRVRLDDRAPTPYTSWQEGILVTLKTSRYLLPADVRALININF